MNQKSFQAHDDSIVGCQQARTNFRRQLLTTASAVVLGATLACSGAKADDGDNPYNRFTFELGGGFQNYSGGGLTWFGTSAPVKISPKNGWDVTGKVTFEPAHSPWIFSVAMQYGRSEHSHAGESSTFPTSHGAETPVPGTGSFSAKADHREQHLVVDFEVGQDVGLGMFGMNGSSVISGGLRYAHFQANTNVAAFFSSYYSTFNRAFTERRTYSGVGPIISWDASAPFFNSDGPFSFDWGIDGAVLFGSHSARIDGFESGVPTGSLKRSKTSVVPSFDAYAALSYHCEDCGAKASLGYKVDSFFHVLDGGGLNGPENVNRIFYGPYLSVTFETSD